MKNRHWILAFSGLLLLLFSYWQLGQAASGLSITVVRSSEPSLHILSPQAVPPRERPLVLVAHGYSGSMVIMRGFAYALAHAGYTVALWDFDVRR